jgi:MFS family permease
MAASFGLALGAALNHYTMSLFGPALLRELGWTKAQFALIGSLPLLTMALVPLAGRFTDRFGTRVAGIVGFTAVPLGFVMLALMKGSIVEFFTIYAIQHVFGILTTSMVFCRVVVERFDAARGMALSLVMSAPPLAGAIAAPLLGEVIATSGWRTGYWVMAAICAVGGVIAVGMMGRSSARADGPREHVTLGRAELFGLLKNPTLLLLIAGMFLVNVPQVFASSQMKLVVMDSGVADRTATWMVSLYALGVIVGRIASGLALDRIQPHLVAMAALGLPAIGYLVFASHITATPLLMAAIMIIGLAQGAESDIGAFLLSRRFPLKNFSLLLSLLTMMIGIGGAAGSLVMSLTLHWGGYVPFLVISAAATLLGAVLFALTGLRRLRGEPHQPTAGSAIAGAELEQAIKGELA